MMQHRFHWFKEHHIRMLQRFEKTQKDRIQAFKQINAAVYEKFKEKIEQNLIITDKDLRRWALDQNRNIGNKLEKFKASKKWINNFKFKYKISSRKITKFVSKQHSKDMEKIKKESTKFVEETKKYIGEQNFIPTCILNADQSGFEKEIHHKRTLSVKGSKTIETVAQSVSALSHSYTVMPIITMEGDFLNPLFIVMAEKEAKFPQKGIFEATNVKVIPSYSHMMTKEHMKLWTREVLLPSMGTQKKFVLLIDSWGTWKGLKNEIPDDYQVEVKTIPKHCTGLVQPCDVFIFRIWKEYVKRISDRVLLDDIEVNLFARDEIIKLQSLIYQQFRSPKFKDWVRYCWYKAGYTSTGEPFGPFIHPIRYSFNEETFPEHCQLMPCENSVLLRCSHCELFICFAHFFESYHFCGE